MFNSLNSLSPKAKIWIYGCNRNLNAEEKEEIGSVLSDFCKSWTAHGAQLTALSIVAYNRFIVLAVDEVDAKASGCSIDSSVEVIRKLDAKYSLDLFNRLRVYVKTGDTFEGLSVAEVSEKMANGEMSENSVVANTLVQNVHELKKNFEIPVNKSWIARKVLAG